jgi:hypothetical protein
MSFSAAAATEQEGFTGVAEHRVVPHPPTAASDGLPVPALVGGIVLAFAVGIAGGQVHRRRRTAHRRSVASARPGPVLTPPARPAPKPPAAGPPAEQPVDLAPAAPAAPPPAPPEAEAPAEQPVDLAGPPRPLPAPPPPEPQAAPPRVVPPPASPAPAAPEPPQRDEPPAERPREPLRLVPRRAVDAPVGETGDAPRPAFDAPAGETAPVHAPAGDTPADAPRPAADAPAGDTQDARREAPLGEAPEVPRLEHQPAEAAEPAIPLANAPETVVAPASEAPAPAAPPARRFARPTPWPEEAHELWTCEIAWKAGYVKSSFRAMAGPPGAGKRRPIGESPSVRWSLMGEPEPPTPELAIRVRALVSALEAAGWEHIGRGPVWYAQRFVWRGSGKPQAVDVPDVEPAER